MGYAVPSEANAATMNRETKMTMTDNVTVGRQAGSAASNQYGTFSVHAATERQVAFLKRLISEKTPPVGVTIPTTLEGISKTMCSTLIDALINQPSKNAPFLGNHSAATQKQLDFIAKLAGERELDESLQIVVGVVAEKPEMLDSKAASKLIDALQSAPRRSTPAEAAPAKANDVWAEIAALAASLPVDTEARHDSLSFALVEDGETHFYRLDRPTQGRWAGYVFLNIQASDDHYPIRNGARIKQVLTDLIADPKAAVARYGLELEKCGHCGRTLTAEESRQIGIGPVCRARMGW